ncbi:hypothetical protein GCM10020358_45300 [Amorphoplanes nipponensis]|uniref:Uncharacterized protein n=1 Tax=Actinoplanes nipponensis TaxID=135950 RepID=A0A919JM68_9ACTN|nr:hypothetical protein [Actinoplanes nipponensis]GIE53594.1 hypothetical protein Ani05nite_71280 [Actinoplanes nipponensis]
MIFTPAKRGLTAAALALAAASALTVSAQPASASSHRPCAIVKHSTTAGITKVGTATATVVADGVKLTTARSANADKVSWQTFFRPVPAATVTEVSYETVKLDSTAGDNNVVNDAALPAYHLYVRTPAGEGVLIFEPYYYLGSIGAGNPQRKVRTEWNVLDGPLWTSSTTIAGLPKTAGGPATLTFAQVVAANPRMTVTGIGFGLGTYNAGVTAVLDEQRFATTRNCTEHQWSSGFRRGHWWSGRR